MTDITALQIGDRVRFASGSDPATELIGEILVLYPDSDSADIKTEVDGTRIQVSRIETVPVSTITVLEPAAKKQTFSAAEDVLVAAGRAANAQTKATAAAYAVATARTALNRAVAAAKRTAQAAKDKSAADQVAAAEKAAADEAAANAVAANDVAKAQAALNQATADAVQAAQEAQTAANDTADQASAAAKQAGTAPPAVQAQPAAPVPAPAVTLTDHQIQFLASRGYTTDPVGFVNRMSPQDRAWFFADAAKWTAPAPAAPVPAQSGGANAQEKETAQPAPPAQPSAK